MIRIVLIFLTFIILNACESAKEGFTLQKQNRADEFLVKKKNPLVLPPDFKKLPEPEDPVKMSREETIETEIDEILSSIKSNDLSTKKVTRESNSSSTENFVIDQIKN